MRHSHHDRRQFFQHGNWARHWQALLPRRGRRSGHPALMQCCHSKSFQLFQLSQLWQNLSFHSLNWNCCLHQRFHCCHQRFHCCHQRFHCRCHPSYHCRCRLLQQKRC